MPRETFAKSMYLECRAWAQVHIAEQLVGTWDSDHKTLHSDGTSTFGEHFGCYQVVTSDSEVLTLGLRKLFTVDATTPL